VKASSRAGGICPAAVSTASRTPTAKKYDCTVTSSHRRSKESARTPPGSASNITGKVFAVCTNETSKGALGASTTSHCAPTVCIQVPIQLMRTPSHSHRNARCRSGAHPDE
jgi:hypothetical protein